MVITPLADGVAVELPEKQGLKPKSEIELLNEYEGLQWNFQKNKD